MRVVIVGGGFGGVKTALELAGNPKFHVTLISDKKMFQYYPALYGTATGHSHLEAWAPLTEIFSAHKNVRLIQDTLEAIEPDRKRIRCKSGAEYEYDNIVLALGVITTYFGIEGLEEHAYGIKSLHEVNEFKNHLHEEITSSGHMDKNYIVVGAGPTGVELAAALVTYLKRISRSHGVKDKKIHVSLVEAAPRVLPRMSEKASASVLKRLIKIGVKVRTGEAVQAEDDNSLTVSGKHIPTQTVVWTSGVTNNPFYKANEHVFQFSKNGRIEVDDHMQAAPHVYVIGDNAFTPHSGLAQTALHDAIYIADHLERISAHKHLKTYKAVLPPTVIPVGERWAIFEWNRLLFSGTIGSWIRRAADFIGYHDILPIGQALGAWRAQTVTEETCPICLAANS